VSITVCSRESQEALRTLAASGVNVAAVALVADGDLGPLAALDLAAGLVPASARISDVHIAAPAGDRWAIDEVRDLIVQPAYLVPTTRCVVIVHQADAMDQACADSLLKLLEEPPSSALFILCVSSHDALPVTLRSRVAHVVRVEPAPVATRLGDLLDLGLERRAASDLLSVCADAHSVVAFVASDPARLPLALAAFSQPLLTANPAAAAHTVATALEELAQAMLESEDGKSNPTARRARARLLSRALVRRWRADVAKALRVVDADVLSLAATAAALDELEAALWRYRPLQPALTQALVTANS
jgi:hypothetical protein